MAVRAPRPIATWSSSRPTRSVAPLERLMSGHAGEGSPAPGVLADDVGWVNHMDSSQDQLLHTQLQQLGLELSLIHI